MYSAPFNAEPPRSGYPVDVVAQYPEESSRGLALAMIIFGFKALLLLPHLFVMGFLGLALMVVSAIGYWAVLFTGRYPEGMWTFIVGCLRWSLRINAWLLGLTDQYPPFSLEGGSYPIDLVAAYPQQSSRGYALAAILFCLKFFLLVPHIFVVYILSAASGFVAFISYWAVLFTGRYPRGMWDFQIGCYRWQMRMIAWGLGITDVYPPFSLSA